MIGIVDSNQKIVASGMIMNLDAGQLRSYSGSGTVWFDLSGQNRTGSLLNGTSYISANGGGFLFDGTDDRWQASFLPGTSSFTVEVVYKHRVNSKYLDTFCGAGSYYDGNDSMGWGFLTAGDDSYTSFYIRSRSVAYSTDVLGTALQDNTFYYFAGTREYVGGQERIAGYRNGALTGGVTGSGGVNINLSGSLYYDPTSPQWVGNLGTYCWAYSPSPTGSIYLVRLYNRALTAAEIQTNHNALKSRFGL